MPAAHDPAFAREFPALADALDGEFAVERELGRGGMGVVFLAREARLDRPVALKVLPPALGADPATRERFLREARTAARLAHPNIVPVYRADEAGGTAFFTMGFVDGQSLAERLRERGPLAPGDAVPVLRAVAWALAYAHARGVVHRDVKPENILLDRPERATGSALGRTLVTDFGIAHRVDAMPSAPRLTADGHVLGTVHYLSPEQARGEPLDGRSDLYALGVVAYEALSGRLPFAGLPAPAVLVAHATRPAPPLREAAPTVPGALAAVVDRCLSMDPADRYATGEHLAEALERALDEVPAAVRAAGPALPPGPPERLDERQAAAVWRRAAQLQADALRRVEAAGEPVRRLATAGDGHPRADAPGEPAASAQAPGYRLPDVASAAEEAGISRQYVAMALAELPRGTLPADAAALGVREAEATRFLGTDVRSVSVTVEVPAPPAAALEVLGATLQRAPFDLTLRDMVGGHPLDGGVLVFDLPETTQLTAAGGVNLTWMGTRLQLEARQVQVTLRAVPGSPGPAAPVRTALTMTADLRPGVRRNVRASQWIAGLTGGSAGLLTGAVLAKGAAVALSAAVLGPAAGVGAGLAGLCVLGYRRLYPGTVRKAEGEMRRALEAAAAALRARAVFGAPPATGPARRAEP